MRIDTMTMETPIGRIAIAWHEDVVLALEMAYARNRTAWDSKDLPGDPAKRLEKRMRGRYPEAENASGSQRAAVPAALARYFAGEVRAIDALRVDPGGEGFHARVWEELRRIPAGETRTYGQIAIAAGSDSARAAGGAVGSNPVPIVVPCHRVVGADGRLTGFGGGLPRKLWLLRHEGVPLPGHADAQLPLLPVE
jgi:methylated-DNA-[protein]-cysteine S-methyltransferase